MFDKLPIGVLIYRLDQFLYANPAFLRWSGHDSLEALTAAGGLDSLFVEPSAADVTAGALLPLTIDRGDKVLIAAELIAIHWEGEPAHALVTSAPVGEPNPAPTQLDEMRAEVAELQSILDAAADGVIMLDRAGHVLSANRGAETLFGEKTEELAGRSFLDLIAPESVDIASEYFESVARGGTAGDGGCEVTGCRRGGGAIPLFMILAATGADTARLCAVFRDITRWKQTEDELLSAKREAEKESSAKSDFLAKISHEIRTPLTAIIGFSEVMMHEQFGPIGNERYRDYLKDIHASGGHLMSLVDDLLDLSKIEAGKLVLTFASVGLNDLTRQCVALMQPQASRGRVIIRTSLPPALPRVMADARSVRQIVLNLLSNSIKFTGAGGQVIVSTALNDNGEVVLRVRDTGIGMSEKDLATALEPFRQLAVASSRGSAGGAGLGLPLTKALAEANRARFAIKSAPKEGTLVEVAFPAVQAAE
jgi:PAS domain S-box-containing protein